MKRDHLTVQRKLARAAHPWAAWSQWRRLCQEAADLACPAPALSDDARAYAFALADFGHRLREARPQDFPVDGASVGWLVEAFVRAARAFLEASAPELRAVIGPALNGCAGALGEIIETALAADARRRNARIMGEMEEA